MQYITTPSESQYLYRSHEPLEPIWYDRIYCILFYSSVQKPNILHSGKGRPVPLQFSLNLLLLFNLKWPPSCCLMAIWLSSVCVVVVPSWSGWRCLVSPHVLAPKAWQCPRTAHTLSCYIAELQYIVKYYLFFNTSPIYCKFPVQLNNTF